MRIACVSVYSNSLVSNNPEIPKMVDFPPQTHYTLETKVGHKPRRRICPIAIAIAHRRSTSWPLVCLAEDGLPFSAYL